MLLYFFGTIVAKSHVTIVVTRYNGKIRGQKDGVKDKMKSFHHITWADRLRIEALLKAKTSKKEIADILGVHISTIYREIKRGRFEHLNADWTTEERYSPDIADQKYRQHLRAKGQGIKISKDPELIKFIEGKIADDSYSPEAALAYIRNNGLVFKTSICTTSLYTYIDKGVFGRLSLEMLPVKRKSKKRKKTVKKQARSAKGDSIEKRPEEIKTRESFGHWEMDTVVGPRGKSKKALLVLTERKTRAEIIELLPDHTSESVIHALNRIERRFGAVFYKIFKTITVDNGSEFADCEGMEKKYRGKKKRTKIYYCHPYSSYERGTNEVNNRLIRRFIPKGLNFDDMTSKEIKEIEEWMNKYPRRNLGYRSSCELYQEELEALGVYCT